MFAAENVKLQVLNLSTTPNCADEVLRTRDRITRARRDPTFRKRVLGQTDAHCLICGTTERAILQAVHVQDVQYGGDDSTDNGICLCANHHLLYDRGLLDINWEEDTFSCSSSLEQRMSWYKEAGARGFKLIQ